MDEFKTMTVLNYTNSCEVGGFRLKRRSKSRECGVELLLDGGAGGQMKFYGLGH
jgi:hypothetical protein